MVVLILTGLLLALAPPASAHVARTSGQYRVTMGWGEEPALSGAQNFVDVEVSGAQGVPVRVPAGALTVQVTTGGAAKTLALEPGDFPGAYRAVLVPTRPGTYAFRVTGRVRGTPLDVAASCSERTFDCVRDASGFQFPGREPTAGEAAARADREIARAERRADERVDRARSLAIGALAVALLALAAAVATAVRARRAPR
jgi:hypothetical protein